MTRYELADRIGAGGMAEIFRGKAIAAGGFEKPVAIKRILPHLSQDGRFVELLIAEANIVSHLRHRNIVQIFDVGRGPDGQYFLVMEFVEGGDLGALQDGLDRAGARLPLDLGLYIGSEVCEALEYAHSAYGPDNQPMRLVHRDVSPSNVLISRSGEVKLTDFGIAKRAEDVTRHGTVRGKLAYISPEQASSGSVDARSDVFSVGIVLYELLLGKRLFSNLADYDALQAVREARIPRPCDVDPSIPPRLDRILCKALAHQPNARYPSAGEMGKELRDIRYAMPDAPSDPAKELASMLQRYALNEGARVVPRVPVVEAEDVTVVKLNSAPGFSLSGKKDFDRDKSYADARHLLDSFEEEVTRAISRDSLMAPHAPAGAIDGYGDGRAGQPGFDTGDDFQTTVMNRDSHVRELQRAENRMAMSPGALPGMAPSVEVGEDDDTDFDPASLGLSPSPSPGPGSVIPRPASGGNGQRMGATPMPAMRPPGPPGPPGAGPIGRPPDTAGQPIVYPGAPMQGAMGSYGAPVQGPLGASRRSWWLVGAGVIAAGIASFFIAGAVLGNGRTETGLFEDSGPVQVDAAVDTATSADAGSDAGPDDAGIGDAGAGDAAIEQGEQGKELDKAEKPRKTRKKRRHSSRRKKRSRSSR